LRVATISPRRMTETVSVIAMISRSLWVIRITVLPWSFSCAGCGTGGRPRRRQHAGRLVEDQDLGAAIERLQDFDALLQADRQLLDERIGIDLEAVFLLQPLQLGARLGDAAGEQAPPSAPSMMFSSTVKFSTSMKC
jgi:hypothetical protein